MNAIAQRHCPTLRRAADGTVAGLVTGALGLLLGIFLGARIGDVVFGGPFAGAVVGAVAGIGLGATAAAIVIRDGSYMHGATTGVVCGLAGRSATVTRQGEFQMSKRVFASTGALAVVVAAASIVSVRVVGQDFPASGSSLRVGSDSAPHQRQLHPAVDAGRAEPPRYF